MEIRRQLAQASIGIVDLDFSPETWMGLGWGAGQYPGNLSAYAWKREQQALHYPGPSCWTEPRLSLRGAHS